jgi:hypothetical protein
MNGLEALQSVQYATVKGKRIAVLSLEDWEALLEWLETIEDTRVIQEASQALRAEANDRERAGWLKWDDVKNDLA